VLGLPAYFLGKQGVTDAMFLPEMLFLESSPRMPHFKCKSIINSTVLTKLSLSFPKTFQEKCSKKTKGTETQISEEPVSLRELERDM
jgi:hypothetical protein